MFLKYECVVEGGAQDSFEPNIYMSRIFILRKLADTSKERPDQRRCKVIVRLQNNGGCLREKETVDVHHITASILYSALLNSCDIIEIKDSISVGDIRWIIKLN